MWQIKGMLTPGEGGLQSQLLEIMRMLLDSDTMDPVSFWKHFFGQVFAPLSSDEHANIKTRGTVCERACHFVCGTVLCGMLRSPETDRHDVLWAMHGCCGGTKKAQTDKFLDVFYEKYIDQLVEVLTAGCPPKGASTEQSKQPAPFLGGTVLKGEITPEFLMSICELMCFCVLHHRFRIK